MKKRKKKIYILMKYNELENKTRSRQRKTCPPEEKRKRGSDKKVSPLLTFLVFPDLSQRRLPVNESKWGGVTWRKKTKKKKAEEGGKKQASLESLSSAPSE